jgi:hypothetical protein
MISATHGVVKWASAASWLAYLADMHVNAVFLAGPLESKNGISDILFNHDDCGTLRLVLGLGGVILENTGFIVEGILAGALQNFHYLWYHERRVHRQIGIQDGH